MINIDKAAAAIRTAQAEVQNIVSAVVASAQKSAEGREDLKGLNEVMKAGDKLTQAVEKLENAKDRTAPKAEEPADGKKGDAKKK